MIAILDYGIGNLKSIYNMFKKVGVESFITSNIEDIKNANKYLLPGVGSFDHGITSLKKTLFSICSNNNYYSLPVDFLNKYLIKLDNNIKDIELKPLLIKSTKLNYNDIDIDNSKYIRILDLYTMGYYKESYDLCLKELENYLTFNINLIEILIKSEIRCATDDNLIEVSIDNNSIIFNIYEYYKSIILKDKNLINSIITPLTNNLKS